MSYIAERRQEERERRRAEILDAAETVIAAVGWDDMTMDQVARKARLSRALLYVYFKDKTDLLFAIGERAVKTLEKRFAEAVARHRLGMDQLEAIGRAYVAFSQEFPVYFDILARCELFSGGELEPGSNEEACAFGGDAIHNLMVATIEAGMRDGSIRADAGNPHVVATVLWGFTHGVIQLATNKAELLTHRGLNTRELIESALRMARRSIAADT